MSKIILGIELKNRTQNSPQFQELLSEYGCVINTRIGLHRTSSDSCSDNGIIILDFCEDADNEANEFEEKLKKINGAKAQKMKF